MTENKYCASFLQSESCDLEEAKKRVINFIKALARADAKRDAVEARKAGISYRLPETS